MNLGGHVAIVTGAGSGIGAAIARRLAREGARVVLAERDVVSARSVLEEISDQGGEGTLTPTDVADLKSGERCVADVLERYGQIDALVNNAGVNFVRATLEVTEADWDRVLGVDLKGSFFFTQAVLRHMVPRRRGAIVNIASVHTRSTLAGAAPYAAAKGGMSAMTRALAVEFGEYGIRINAVCPGLTDTRIWTDLKASADDPAAVVTHWMDHIPMGRAQSPDEVASVVAFLLSDEASYVHGAEIFVDGGMTSLLTGREHFAARPILGGGGG